MMRKILEPVLTLMFKPHFNRLKASEPRFQGAVKLYENGDKRSALKEFKELINENPSDKASRGWVGQISGELDDDKSENVNKLK